MKGKKEKRKDERKEGSQERKKVKAGRKTRK